MMIPQDILTDDAANRLLVDTLERLKRERQLVTVVDETPSYLTEMPTVLYNRGSGSLLLCDTDEWVEFPAGSYSRADIDALLAGKSDTSHTHTEGNITDLDKYTQNEVDTLLAGKSDTSHAHDERYYTETETDALLAAKGDAELTVVSKTATYTALATDDVVLCTGTFTVTLPTAVGIAGKAYYIKNVSTGVVTLDGAGSETMDGETTLTLSDDDSVEVVSDGSNWRII